MQWKLQDKQLTDAELEKVLMDCAGLGTSATRAEIIEKLVKYEYLSRKGNVIYPTDQGIEYVDDSIRTQHYFPGAYRDLGKEIKRG